MRKACWLVRQTVCLFGCDLAARWGLSKWLMLEGAVVKALKRVGGLGGIYTWKHQHLDVFW